ncbi:MAG: response regulator [Myxococcaceae bacterium]
MTDLFTTYDVSRMLQVDASTVAKWIDKGLLVAFRTPGGHRRIRATDLRSFCIAHQMPIPEELGSQKVRLLAVDDEKAALTALKRALQPYSDRIELNTTTSGIDALLMVFEEKPHGLVVDLNLPDVSGLEILRKLRSRPQLEHVRLFAMSAKASDKAQREALDAGAEAFFEKPVSAEKLLELFRVPVSLVRAS